MLISNYTVRKKNNKLRYGKATTHPDTLHIGTTLQPARGNPHFTPYLIFAKAQTLQIVL